MTEVVEDRMDVLLRTLDEAGHPPEYIDRLAQAAEAEHKRLQAEAQIAETAHVHDVAHVAVITTTPLAHLKEDAAKGADLIVLQPRHAASGFGYLVLGEGKGKEEVKVLSVRPRWSRPFPDGPPVPEVIASLVVIEGITRYSHRAGVAVSAPGFDPETVDASDVVCHDCGRELASDRGSVRILVCQRVHGIRPTKLVPKHADGAVECGLPRET